MRTAIVVAEDVSEMIATGGIEIEVIAAMTVASVTRTAAAHVHLSAGTDHGIASQIATGVMTESMIVETGVAAQPHVAPDREHLLHLRQIASAID